MCHNMSYLFSASPGKEGGRVDGWMPPHPGDEGIMGSGGGEAAAESCWLSRCLVTKHVLALGGARLYSTWRSASNATPPRSQIWRAGQISVVPSRFIRFVDMVIMFSKPDVPNGGGE